MESRLPSPTEPFKENYAIMLLSTEPSQLVGVIGIPRLSHDGLAAEVGYLILPAAWGKGIASEALSLFTQYYFDSSRESPFLLSS